MIGRRAKFGVIWPSVNLCRFAKAQDRKEAGGILPSCIGLRPLEVLPILECDLGKSVLSSHQAALWMLFRLCGNPALGSRCDFGSLFSK